MSEAHALLSPSGSEGWISCPAKLAAEKGLPSRSTKYADEGSAAHEIAKTCLTLGISANTFIGACVTIGDATIEVTQDMAFFAQKYVDNIREKVERYTLLGAETVQLLVETKVDFSEYVGIPNQTGTCDALILVTWPDDRRAHIDVTDLKFGMGVQVYAENNTQMMMYALGALDQFSCVADFGTVSMSIHQPRKYHLDEWVISVDKLLSWADTTLKPAAQKAVQLFNSPDKITLTDFAPGDKQCRFCKAKATCEAAAQKALSLIANDFVDLSKDIGQQIENAKEVLEDRANLTIAHILPHLDFVESWCKAVRSEAETRMLKGETIDGFKLVKARRGPRKWTNSAEVEQILKKMRLKKDEMYDFVVISPTSAEKLLSGRSPAKWRKLQSYITQSEGGLSVAPLSDKRPAEESLSSSDDFDVLP